jgi:hypothetical protein
VRIDGALEQGVDPFFHLTVGLCRHVHSRTGLLSIRPARAILAPGPPRTILVRENGTMFYLA